MKRQYKLAKLTSNEVIKIPECAGIIVLRSGVYTTYANHFEYLYSNIPSWEASIMTLPKYNGILKNFS
jgi:hypothetical protein